MFVSHLSTVGFDILLKGFWERNRKGKKRERSEENKSNETEYLAKYLSTAITRLLRLHFCDGFKIIKLWAAAIPPCSHF